MFTHRNPLMTHGSIFRNENTKQTCQIVCVDCRPDDSLFILANLYVFPFEIIREWDAMTLSELERYMHESDNLYRYMGKPDYYAEEENNES